MPPHPQRVFLSHLQHPAYGPNLRDQGPASCVALGTGCPFLPKGPQQLLGPVQTPP